MILKNKKLFGTFCFPSASYCLSIGHNARIAPSFRTAICSKQIQKFLEINL